MMGTFAALVVTQLANIMPGTSPAAQLAYAATVVTTLCFVVGFIASFWLPEPEEQLME